jgi:hypothetical protein
VLWQGEYVKSAIPELFLHDPEEKGIQNGEKGSGTENGDDRMVHAHKGGTLQDGIITDIMVLHLRTKRARAPPALN